jgi:hypothetical protein
LRERLAMITPASTFTGISLFASANPQSIQLWGFVIWSFLGNLWCPFRDMTISSGVAIFLLLIKPTIM